MARVRSAPQRAIGITGRLIVGAIKSKTARHVDASNSRFPSWTPIGKRKGPGPYSPEQERKRRKAGKQTANKDLAVSREMLNSLAVRNGMVTVGPQHQKKAQGQMEHPKWRYHHRFLLVGDDTKAQIEKEIARDVVR